MYIFMHIWTITCYLSIYIYCIYTHCICIPDHEHLLLTQVCKVKKVERWSKIHLSYRWHGASLIMTMNAQEILFSTCWFIAKKLSLCTRMLLSAAHRLLPYNPVSVQLTRSFFQAHNFWTALLLGKTEKAVLGLEDRSLWKSSSVTFAAC